MDYLLFKYFLELVSGNYVTTKCWKLGKKVSILMKSDFFSEAYQDKLGIPGNRVRVQTSKTISLFAQRRRFFSQEK